MKLEACKELIDIRYEVNISSCFNHKWNFETRTFPKLSIAKEYIEADYSMKKLAGSIQYYTADINKKTECVMYKFQSEVLNEI